MRPRPWSSRMDPLARTQWQPRGLMRITGSSFQHRKQLADARFIGMRAVLANLESFIKLRGISLPGPVPLHQRFANGGARRTVSRALQPSLPLYRVLRNFA